MRTLSQISLADVADAVRRLSPDKEAFELIAGVLGFKIESGDAPDKTIKPLRSSRYTGDREKSKTEIANLPQNDEVPPKPSHKEPDVNYEGDTDGSIVFETLSSGHSRAVPSYIQQSAPLDSAAFSLSPATNPRPLLPHHQARSFVWEMLAQDLPSTEIDCDAIIDQLSRGMIPELRFLKRKSIRKGVHLLVDESPVMLPYRNDVLDLQRSIKNIIGPSLSGNFSFDELPDRGVVKSTGKPLSNYPFPGAETTVLLVSDFGVTRPFGYQNVSANEWADFLKRLVKSSCRVIVVSPYGEDWLSKLDHKGVSIVHWGTKHHSNTKVSAKDFARLLSPAALLDMAFIREARIKLFPEASPGLEADLLFSWMVAVFNSRVVSFRQEMVRELRDELMLKPSELKKALDFLKEYREKNDTQPQLPERIAFEEQLVTDALTQNTLSVEQAFARLIRSLIEDDMNPKLARWAIAVADELPQSVSDAPLYRELQLAAQLRLGIISENFNTPHRENASVGNCSWLLPTDVKLGIRREKGKLVITDSPRDKDVIMRVPGTVPRHLIVAPIGKPRIAVQIWPERPDVILPFAFPMDIFSPLSGARYRLKLAKLVFPEFLPDELLIFIGHSDDASAEANAILELLSKIENDFRLLLKSNGNRSIFRRIRLWEWTLDALALTGGQERAVTPVFNHAQIAIFVFKDRIGKVTWEELEKAIKSSAEKNIHILAFFPANSHLQGKYPDAQAKLQAARDWALLLERQAELTQEWCNSDSRTVMLCPTYQDAEELKTIVREKVRIAIADILSVDITRPTAELSNHAEELRRYQGALKTELGTISLLGTHALENIPVTLTDTFVSLRISDTWRTDMRWNPKVSYESQQEERIRNSEEVVSLVFETFPLLLVIGDPGSGKTTLLKHYALSCLENQHYTTLGFKEPVLVFYLPLRELVKSGADYDSLPANLFAWSEKHTLLIAETVFFDWLHNCQTLLLLDGLDEISDPQQRIKACDWIDRIVTGFEKAKVVVTTRYTGYRKGDGIELRSQHVRADIMDFSTDQQKEFLQKWFMSVLCRELRPATKTLQAWREEQAKKAAEKAATIIAFLEREENQSLRLLAAVPMLLQIMAILWKDRQYLPKTRSELYNAAVNYILDYRDRQKEIYPLLGAEDARRVLTPVSLWMQEELEKDEADKALMQAEMQKHLKTLHQPPSVENFCDNLIDRAGLLVAYGDKEYRFRHKSFREYMASVQLVKNIHKPGYLDMLVSHFGDNWWEETLIFFIGQIDEEIFDAFMQRLFDSPISAVFSQKQQDLLITLVQEAPEKKIDALQKKLLDPETTFNRQGYLLECLKVIGTPAVLDVLYQFILMIRTKYIDTAIRVEDIIISMRGKIPAPDLDDESTYNEIPVKYVHHTDSRLRNEVFAIELLKNNIYLQKKENGRITVIIDRNDVQNAVITSRAKGNICKKFITENNKKQLVQKDKEIHDFLSETINNKKQYEINLSQLKIPLRWASGGVFSVVRYKGKKWTPFFFRDVKPFGWNISLGASERHFSKDGKSLISLNSELTNPWKFIAREFLEETLVLNREPAKTKDQIAKKFTFGITDIRQQREDALKFINAHIECRRKYDNLRIITTQEKLEPANYDVRTRLQATNTDLIIRREGEDTFHDDVLVCFNLLELGIEIVKIAEYDLADTDYLLDGEILEHYDGNSKLIQELVRMPFALISHSYLENTFGGDFEPNYTMDTAQPSIIGKPIQSEDIHIFDWDVIQRVKILKGDLDPIGIEKKRYEGWYKQFKQYFLDDNDNPTTKNPSLLFTPASAKIVTTYFANKKGK